MGLLTRLLICLALLPFALSPAAAQGTVEGTLEMNGETVPITHVYAREAIAPASSDAPGHVIIMMTDRPAPPELRASRRAFTAAAREGRIRGILLVLEPEPRFVLLAPGDIEINTPVPDTLELISLADLRREGPTVSGRLQMAQVDEVPTGDNDETFDYRANATFNVPVDPAPRATATLTGEAARTSAEAQAAARLLQVVHGGSVEEVRAVLHPDHAAWSRLSGEDAAMVLAMAREFMPSADTLLRTIVRVRVYDDLVLIAAREDEVTTTLAIRRDGEQWRLAEVPRAND